MALPATFCGLLLASFDGLQAAGRRLHSPGSSRETAIVVVALVAVAALWAGLYMWDRRRQPAIFATDAAGMFGELCRAHRLDKSDRAFLNRAASGLPNAAIIFIDPEVLDRFSAANPLTAEECRRLRDKLFGTPASETAV